MDLLDKMMENQFSSYVWEEHHDKTKESWRLLFENNKFTDVTLVCGDQKTIEAHRLILSACSPVFAKILDQNTSAHPWIYLRGIDYEELKSIIEFIYLGASSLESSKVNEFFEIAADLEVSSITKSQESARTFTKEEVLKAVLKTECKNKVSTPLPPTLDEVTVDDSDEEMGQAQFTSQQSSFMDDSFVDSYGVPMDDDDDKPKWSPKEQKSKGRNKCFSCNICNAKCASKGGVQLHIKLKHDWPKRKDQNEDDNQKKEEEKMSPDNDVEPKKPNISDFYLVNDDNRITCLVCGVTFHSTSSTEVVEKHLKDKHECQWEVFHCLICTIEFTNHQQFQQHGCNSKGITICDECGYEAENILDLKKHTKAHHPATKFKCNLCNFRAPEKPVLKMHIMQVHIGKTFTCVRCNFSTKKRAQLKMHLKEAHPEIPDAEGKSLQSISLDKENVEGLNQLVQYNKFHTTVSYL